jgi:membrane dipeptidase
MTHRFGVAYLLVSASIMAFAETSFSDRPEVVDRRLNRVSQPARAASSAARSLMGRLPIIDLHTDTLLWDRDIVRRNSFGHVDLPRLIDGGILLETFAVATRMPARDGRGQYSGPDRIVELAQAQGWPEEARKSPFTRALFLARRLDRAIEASGGRIVLMRSKADLKTLLEKRKGARTPVGALLSIEGAHALGDDLRRLSVLHDAGFRMIGLAHFNDNAFAGSAQGAERGGLTELGRALIRGMEAKGMIVDLAHASPRTIDDVLAMARKPVIASHTGVRGTCDIARNLSDDALRGVARTGGMVGIAFFPQALCGEGVEPIVGAIRHAARVAGVDHVALGSDFDGSVVTPFDVAHLDMLVERLLAAGFEEREISRIMGGNALRVLEATLP